MSVFISYSRTDNEFVDLLQQLLVNKGYSVWVDRNEIGIGKRWDREVTQALDDSTFIVVVLSQKAAESENVADEWSYALDTEKTVIPLLYGCQNVPLRLRRLQRIDFEEDQFAVAFKKLVNALGEPDNRPSDLIQLAKREGMVFIELGGVTGEGAIRIAFDYRDYPQIGSFLRTVWFTLLWRVFKQGKEAIDSYGSDWFIRDKTTQQICELPEHEKPHDALLSEFGIEPGLHLEVIVTKSRIRY